jgi:DNA-binding transcriptional LysR family regulator
MELRHVRYFLAVAEALSFTAAARRLNISQPPLSQQIADLEREVGARLFERHSRHVELTEAGRTFRRHAEALVAQAKRAADETRAVGQGSDGVLHVAATSSVIYSGLALRIADFRRDNPGVRIVIHELSPQDQLEQLTSKRVDVCFARFAPEEQDIRVRRAWRENAGLVVPRGHRLDGRKSVRIASLRNEEFVFYRLPESSFATQLHAICVQQGFAPRIVQEVVEALSVLSLVAAGHGIGFVPELLGRNSGIPYLPIIGPRPSADVHALTAKFSSPLAERFAAFAAQT